MDYGEIKVLDTPENLKNSLEGDIVTLEVDKSKVAEKIKGLEEVKRVHVINNKIFITVKNAENFAPKIIDFLKNNGTVVKSISIRKPSLGDVFLHHTGREIREEKAEKPEMERFRRRV
jgi:ABC-2 type transport system ATP-binding protein